MNLEDTKIQTLASKEAASSVNFSASFLDFLEEVLWTRWKISNTTEGHVLRSIPEYVKHGSQLFAAVFPETEEVFCPPCFRGSFYSGT